MEITLVTVVSVPFLLVVLVLMWLLWDTRKSTGNLITQLEKSHQDQRVNWERERERLLNRAMTREWTSYVQMQGAMQNGVSTSESAQGMSDEEELRRAGFDPEGFGETYVDEREELEELGIR